MAHLTSIIPQKTSTVSNSYKSPDKWQTRRKTFKRIRKISSNSCNLNDIPESLDSDWLDSLTSSEKKSCERSNSDQTDVEQLRLQNSQNFNSLSRSHFPNTSVGDQFAIKNYKFLHQQTMDSLFPPNFSNKELSNNLIGSNNAGPIGPIRLSQSAFNLRSTGYEIGSPGFGSSSTLHSTAARSSGGNSCKSIPPFSDWFSLSGPFTSSQSRQPLNLSKRNGLQLDGTKRSSANPSKTNNPFFIASTDISKLIAPRRYGNLLSKRSGTVSKGTTGALPISKGSKDQPRRSPSSEIIQISTDETPHTKTSPVSPLPSPIPTIEFIDFAFNDENNDNDDDDVILQPSSNAAFENDDVGSRGSAFIQQNLLRPPGDSATNLLIPPGNSETMEVRRRRSVMHRNQMQKKKIGADINTRNVTIAKRTLVADVSVCMALGGILVMMITEEMCSGGLFETRPITEQLLRVSVMLSSFVLVGCVVAYYILSTQLLMLDYGAEDWRVTVSMKQFSMACLECCICAITPWPFFAQNVQQNSSESSIDKNIDSPSEQPFFTYKSTNYNVNDYVNYNVNSLFDHLNIAINDSIGVLDDADRFEGVHYAGSQQILSVLMFLKCYLVFRCLVLHSKQFKDTGTRSVAALNNVSVNVDFVIRSLLKESPLRVVILFTTFLWLIISWCYTHCERHFLPEQVADLAYLQSLYVVGITFLTVGYGDVVPRSICGRVLATFTGITGLFVASVLIATVQNALRLSRSELHINNFMSDTENQRAKRNSAAQVIQQTWHIYKCHQLCNDQELIKRQRKFVDALMNFRKFKQRQRHIAEENSSLMGLEQVNTMIQSQMKEYLTNQEALIESVSELSIRTDRISYMLEQYLHNRITR